jgi:hypothetical protein
VHFSVVSAGKAAMKSKSYQKYAGRKICGKYETNEARKSLNTFGHLLAMW